MFLNIQILQLIAKCCLLVYIIPNTLFKKILINKSEELKVHRTHLLLVCFCQCLSVWFSRQPGMWLLPCTAEPLLWSQELAGHEPVPHFGGDNFIVGTKNSPPPVFSLNPVKRSADSSLEWGMESGNKEMYLTDSS